MFKRISNFLYEFCNAVFLHTPKDKLNENEKEQIRKNGLVHFTRSCCLNSILKDGVDGRKGSALSKNEVDFAWFYIYDASTFDSNYDRIKAKGERKNYDACIIIRDLSKEQLDGLLIRRKYDGAVVYKGALKTNNMEGYKGNKDFNILGRYN